MTKPKRKQPSIAAIRRAVADYMWADIHETTDDFVDAMYDLGKALQIPKAKEGGYDFFRYRSKP